MRKLACALVVALLGAACSDASETSLPGRPSGEPPATKAEDTAPAQAFVAEVNEACDRNDVRMGRIRPPGPPRSWLRYGRHLDRVFTDTLRRLDAADPPPSLARDYRKWIRKLERSRRAFRSLYRTVALRYPAVDTPEDRVNRAIDRADRVDRRARQFAQLRLTDLSSCYDALPFMHARIAATQACGGFLFCR